MQNQNMQNTVMQNTAMQNTAMQTPVMQNTVMQNTAMQTPVMQNTAMQNTAMQSVEPVYGCLKNGKKPTWSQYNKTLKKGDIGPTPTNKIQFVDPPLVGAKVYNVAEMNERQNKLNLLKTRIATPLKKYKRTLKKYKLGKNKKNLTVGVLIKSGKTRKLVKDETLILKSRCLSEVKQYLRKHNLICAGTNAPENVIRKIYEDSFLAGKIFNKNPTTLLHNYMNETD